MSMGARRMEDPAMTERKTLYREDFKTFYKVNHQDKGGFGGNTTQRVAVTEETDTEIIGHIFGPFEDRPGPKVTIRKENVAGWEEKEFVLDSMLAEGETPSLWVSEIREKYMNGRISEDRMAELLESAKDIESATVSDGESKTDDSTRLKIPGEAIIFTFIIMAVGTVVGLEIMQAPVYLGSVVLLIEFVVCVFLIQVCSNPQSTQSNN